MAKTSAKATIYGRLVNVSVGALEVFFFVAGGFGSFFWGVPLSSYSNPKNAGCGDNKRPFNRT
jgi:hypothetical protein